MIEIILHKEVSVLYDKASTAVGLSVDDIKKLEILSKIKHTEKDSPDDEPEVPESLSKEQLIQIARLMKDENDGRGKQGFSKKKKTEEDEF